MSDPWNEAWEEAEASNPAGTVVYDTLELQHPAFLDENDNPMPIRCVNGVHDDMFFGIEPGAVFNPASQGLFQAIPFYAERPEFAEGKTPEVEITVDNVGRELMPHLENAVQVKADLVVIYRQYISDDLSEPCAGPIEFVMRKVRVKGTSVVGSAKLDDLANRKFPFKVYSPHDFPGLLS